MGNVNESDDKFRACIACLIIINVMIILLIIPVITTRYFVQEFLIQ